MFGFCILGVFWDGFFVIFFVNLRAFLFGVKLSNLNTEPKSCYCFSTMEKENCRQFLILNVELLKAKKPSKWELAVQGCLLCGFLKFESWHKVSLVNCCCPQLFHQEEYFLHLSAKYFEEKLSWPTDHNRCRSHHCKLHNALCRQHNIC